MKELHDLLDPLVNLLGQSELKSKQAAFNRYYDDLVKAKALASWNVISCHINKLTGDTLTEKSINALFHRAKTWHNKQAIEKSKSTNQTKNSSSSISQNRTILDNPLSNLSQKNNLRMDYNPTPDKNRIYGDD